MRQRRRPHAKTIAQRSGKLRVEQLEVRRLLNAAPVGNSDKYYQSNLAATGIREFSLAAPGVLANDFDPDGDPLQAILIGIDEGASVRLQSDGGFTLHVAADRFEGGFAYLVSDGETTSGPYFATFPFGRLDVQTAIWSAEEGGAGQTYVAAPIRIPEPSVDALLAATSDLRYLGAAGHLATLTTPEENAFAQSVFGNFPLIGAYQDHTSPDYQEPDGGWRWVTDEPWDFTNWSPIEPNNFGSGEDAAQLYYDGLWNDVFVRSDPYVLMEYAEGGAFPGDDVVLAPLQGEIAIETLLANDVISRPGMTVEIVDAPSLVEAVAASDGTVVLRTNGAQPYRDRLTYRLVDDDFVSSVATVWLTVGGDNWPTQASSEVYSVDAGGVLETDGYRWRSVLANDSDRDALPLSAILQQPPAGGELEFRDDGRFRFTPLDSFVGTTTFTYVATDGYSRSAPVEVAIQVRPTGVPRSITKPDEYRILPGEILNVPASQGLLVNDVAFGLPEFGVVESRVRTTAGGLVELHRDGSFGYVPPPGLSGPDRFVYRARIAGEPSSESFVDLTLDGSQLVPKGTRDEYMLDRTGYLEVSSSSGVALNDVGYGSNWSVVLVREPRYGSLQLSPNGAFTYRTIENDPVAGIEDKFLYVLSDGTRTVGPIAVELSRASLPNATRVAWPDAPGDPAREYLVTPQPSSHSSRVDWFAADEASLDHAIGDRRGRLLTITSEEEQAFVVEQVLPLLPDGATVWLGARQNAFDSSHDGAWTWTTGEPFDFENWAEGVDMALPEEAFSQLRNQGSLDGAWEVDRWDGRGDVAYAIFEFSQYSDVIPSAPSDDAYAMNDEVLVIPAEQGLLSNDQGDTGGLTVELVRGPQHGELQLESNGAFEYSPTDDAAFDAFEYRVVGGEGSMSTATAWLSAPLETSPPYYPPVANPDLYYGVENQVIAATAENGVLRNDFSETGAALTARLVEAPRVGEILFSDDGSFAYRPPHGVQGVVAFTYAARDGVSEEITRVELRLRPEPDPVVATPDMYQLIEAARLAVDAASGVLANDVDAAGAGMDAFLVDAPQFGEVELAFDGSFFYTPSDAFWQGDYFTYQAYGFNGGVSSPQTVFIAADDPPLVAPAFGERFVSNGSDVVAGDVLIDERKIAEVRAGLVQSPLHGRLNLLPSGEFEYIADPGFSGRDEFTYAVEQKGRAISYARAQLQIISSGDQAEFLSDVRVRAETGGRGSAYALVRKPGTPWADGWDWGEANYLASQMTFHGVPGRLATPATEAEWRWLDAYVGDTGWLGGVHDIESPDYLEPDLGWEWTSGDDWTYTNWGLGEPDDASPNGYGQGADRLAAVDGRWEDFHEDWKFDTYFVEFPGDFASPLTTRDAVYHAASDSFLNVTATDGLLADVAYFPSGWELEIVDAPSHGAVDVFADGAFTYSPAAGSAGVDFFTYRLVGDDASTNVATAWILVGVHPPPEGGDDDYYVFEDQQFTTGPETSYVADFNDGVIPDWLETSPKLVVQDGSLQSQTSQSVSVQLVDEVAKETEYVWQVDIDPAKEFNFSSGRRMRIGVEPQNATPKFGPGDSEPNVYFEFAGNSGTDQIRVFFHDGDTAERDTIGYFEVDANFSVRIGVQGGAVVAELDADYLGVFEAEYARSSNFLADGDSNLQPYVLTESGNYLIRRITYAVPGGPSLLANDRDLGAAPQVAIVDAPSHGVLTLGENGAFSYVPDPDFHGLDAFRYVAESEGARTRPTTVSLNVVARPDAYQLRDDEFTLSSGDLRVNRLLAAQLGSNFAYDPTRSLLWLSSYDRLRTGEDCEASGLRCDESLLAAWSVPENRVVKVIPQVGQHSFSDFVFSDDYSVMEFAWFRKLYRADVDEMLRPEWTIADAELVRDDSQVSSEDRYGFTVLEWQTNWRYALGWKDDPSQPFYVQREGDSVTATPVEFVGASDAWEFWTRLQYRNGLVSPDGRSWWSLDESNYVLTYRTETSPPLMHLPYFQSTADATYRYGRSGQTLTISDDVGSLLAGFDLSSVTNEAWWAVLERDPSLREILIVAQDGVYSLDLSRASLEPLDLLSNDDVVDRVSEEVLIVERPQHGVVNVTQRGEAVYLPEPGFVGEDSFQYQLVLGEWKSNVAVVSLHVQSSSAQVAPIARADAYTVFHEELSVAADQGVLANDVVVEATSAVLKSSPGHGAIELAGDGSFTYRPDAGFVGEDAFEYYLDEQGVQSAEVQVSLTVTPRLETTVVFTATPTTVLRWEEPPPSLAAVAVGEQVVVELWVRNLAGAPDWDDRIEFSLEFETALLQAAAASNLGWFAGGNDGGGPQAIPYSGGIENISAAVQPMIWELGDDWARIAFATLDAVAPGVAAATPGVQFPEVFPEFSDGLSLRSASLLITSPADVDLDGDVDLVDFSKLKAGFGRPGDRAAGDVNGDGVVDLIDFVMLKEAFGFRADDDDDEQA